MNERYQAEKKFGQNNPAKSIYITSLSTGAEKSMEEEFNHLQTLEIMILIDSS